MLGAQIRRILSWVTVAVIAAVIVSGMAVVLRQVWPDRGARSLQIVPAEVVLCPDQEVTFRVEPQVADVEWAATGGGEISPEGRFVAGEPGDVEVRAAGPRGGQGRAIAYVTACTPTPTPLPTLTSLPTPTPTPETTPIAEADPQGDVSVYETGAPATQPPAGLDIRNASIAPDRRLTLGVQEGLPGGLAQWVQEGEAVLWIALNDPIPDALAVRTDWLFALDLDGDSSTGRPAGARPINPDLGYEVALGVYYDPASAAYVPYLLVWNPTAQDWEGGPAVRHWISEDRTLVALALPLYAVRQEVERVTGVMELPEAALGRAATIAYTSPDVLADLYPDPQ
jgi:hypothetical protein